MTDGSTDRVYNVMIPVVANVAAPDRARAIEILRTLVEEHGLTVYPDGIDAFAVEPDVRPCPLPTGCAPAEAQQPRRRAERRGAA